MKKTAVVICPGRGTYNKTELGYLHRYHSDKMSFIQKVDKYRFEKDQESIWGLDTAEQFSPARHLPGENSAALIYACSYLDYLSINKENIEIVAITGNSMGWYLALTCAGALNESNGTHLINTMGSQMKDGIIGGQIIYPEVDENWIFDHNKHQLINETLRWVNSIPDHQIYDSIYFGGYRILGGNEQGLNKLLKELPLTDGRYPFRLVGNAAFHTPLLDTIIEKSRKELPSTLFQRPKIPLVDGKGKIWSPYSTNVQDLWDYTLGAQINQTYNFSLALEVAIKEFAPDYVILTGPGTTMGGAVAQILINKKLKAIKDKNDFKNIQNKTPYLISLAEANQRKIVVNS